MYENIFFTQINDTFFLNERKGAGNEFAVMF